jgi:hypothetical protein
MVYKEWRVHVLQVMIFLLVVGISFSCLLLAHFYLAEIGHVYLSDIFKASVQQVYCVNYMSGWLD